MVLTLIDGLTAEYPLDLIPKEVLDIFPHWLFSSL